MPILIKSKRLLFHLMILLFLILLFYRITTHIKFDGKGWSTYLPYILFLVVFTFRRRPFWLIGLLYSFYGIYDFLFVIEAYPNYTVFTLPIVELHFGDGGGFSTKSPLVHYLLNFPFFFYSIYITSYLISKTVTMYNYLNNSIPNNQLNEILDQNFEEK